jgi:hypothetical protein
MLARLDGYVEREKKRGVNITRTDAVRILLADALDRSEGKSKKSK